MPEIIEKIEVKSTRTPLEKVLIAGASVLALVVGADQITKDFQEAAVIAEFQRVQDSIALVKQNEFKARAVVMKQKNIPSRIVIDSITPAGDTLVRISPERTEQICRKTTAPGYISLDGDTIFSTHILKRDGIDESLAEIVTVPVEGLDFATKNIMLDMR